MTTIRELDQINLEDYEKFVSLNSERIFFQSKKAIEFFEHLDNYKLLLFTIEKENQIRASLMATIIKENGLKSFFSRRCIVWAGPVFQDGYEDLVDTLLKAFGDRVSKMAIYIEFRNFFNTSKIKKYFLNNSYQYNEHFNSIINTSNLDIVKLKLSKSKRRQINQSFINGAQIIEPNNISQVQEFYDILNSLYKKRVRKPLPNFDFFKAFYFKKELGKYFLISFENRIIGGIMCPIDKDTIYEWFICGLDGSIKNVYPSVLATWAPIEYAAKTGIKWFDFMGAGKPNEDYGVREFKLKFGGELVEYGRFFKVLNPTLFCFGKAILNLNSKIGVYFRKIKDFNGIFKINE